MEMVASLLTLRVTRLKKQSSSHCLEEGWRTCAQESRYRSKGVQFMPVWKVVL